jgi:hypothetical protein
LLSTFEGETSELFVLDLPENQLGHVVGVIAALPSVVVEVCAGESFEVPRTLDVELLRRMQAPTAN